MAYPPPSPSPGDYPGAPGPQPSSTDPLAEWGVKPNPSRPQKVNWLTQSLWAYMGVSVLMLLFSLVAVVTAPWWAPTGFILVAGVFGLIFHAVSIVIVWFIVKEKFGVWNASDPRNLLVIGLGVLGFIALSGFFGGWSLGWYAVLGGLLSLVRLGAVGAAFALAFQPEVEQWLRSRPGNQPKTPPASGYPQQPPTPGYPPQGYPQQPPPPPGQPPVQH